MKQDIVRVTRESRVNIPKDFVEFLGLNPDSFAIITLQEESRMITIQKGKVIPEN